MSIRRRKIALLNPEEPSNGSIRKENDGGNPTSFLQESIDPSDMPPGNFLKLEWNAQNSPVESGSVILQESVELDTRLQEEAQLQTQTQEVIIVTGEKDGVPEDDDNNLYMNYSMLTDQLISGHFLTGATAEEVFNGEPSRSKGVISDILCDKFKCHHCNLSFLSHQFYKNHLKKCIMRRTDTTSNNNFSHVEMDNESKATKRKRAKKQPLPQASLPTEHLVDGLCNSDSDSSDDYMNIEDAIRSKEGMKFKCDSCKCVFSLFNEMKDHLCFRNTQHQCDLCMKKCPTKAAFYDHLERSHKIQISSVLAAPPSQTFPVLGKVFPVKNLDGPVRTGRVSNRVVYAGVLNSG